MKSHHIFLPMLILTALLTTLFWTSCSRTPDTNPLSRAEKALKKGKYQDAQEICDSLLNKRVAGSFTPDTLCALSSIYMALAEYDNIPGNTARAVKLIERAFQKDSLQVLQYISEQPAEQRANLNLALSISGALDTTRRQDAVVYNDQEIVELIDPDNY